ncbi:DsrE family protein [Cognatiluteimonas profundi]|uniref:DsrE family protein n=1 Tax=Cognatiluteimonas profundi TaxID=2594501 RepID=UPI0018EEFCAF|nr:DsrE family protein [Lysobacter profundi]
MKRSASAWLLAMILPTTAMAAQPVGVRDFGAIATTTGASEHADHALRYRVVFAVTRGADAPDKVDPSLERVARFVNLLAADGVQPKPGDIVAVISGPATVIALSDKAYVARTGSKGNGNPNLPLVERLRAAGVVVSVCSQALHGMKIPAEDVTPSVRRDVAAMMTIANLQLRGYALMPD